MLELVPGVRFAAGRSPIPGGGQQRRDVRDASVSRRTVPWLAVAALGTAVSAPPASGLNIGDKAPPLSVSEWVQGEPVDLKKDLGKKLYMVEFWATWCPPCKMSVPLLTKLQEKYKKDLTIIGVTAPDDRGNTASAIKRFVKERAAQMTYHVAIDKNEATTNAYLAASGVAGIPYAYLVGKDGSVVWHGSPLEPTLPDIVEQILTGKYDMSAAKKAAEVETEVNRRIEELQMRAQAGQWSAVWDSLVGILKIDPSHTEALDMLLRLYANETQTSKAFREWATGHIAANRSNTRAMQRFAAVLCLNDDLATRAPDLAIEAARAAYESGNPRDASVIATYALAVYEVGALDRAIALQEEAVSAAGDERETKETKAVLEYFKKCKELQSSLP
ncbi:MAG: TlpA family protein disulfide reductase [Planctomycetes bacterium]|nr:TlpA family protein disulfide reductase [Planctomycetota bacterium]